MVATIIALMISFYSDSKQSDQVRFLNKVIPASKIVCTINDIPYQVCVTQAAVETGYGKAVYCNNLFGIKRFSEGKYGYAKYNSQLGSLLSYNRSINKHYSFAVRNYSNSPVKFLIWIWGTGYAKSDNYVETSVSVMNGIYKRSGDESFNISVTNEELKIIGLIKKEKYGSDRRNLTRQLL